MAQFKEFYTYHKKNGDKFKTLIIDSGLYDKKIGFPISAVEDKEAYNLYRCTIEAKALLKQYIKENRANNKTFEIYIMIKRKYLCYISKYHKVRTY